MRALIVDDDKTFCQLLTKILRGNRIEADWATNSLVGYDLSPHLHYDLFILDVRMSLLLEARFAEGVKKGNPAAKIILISAIADKTLQQIAADLGAPALEAFHAGPFAAGNQGAARVFSRSVSTCANLERCMFLPFCHTPHTFLAFGELLGKGLAPYFPL